MKNSCIKSPSWKSVVLIFLLFSFKHEWHWHKSKDLICSYRNHSSLSSCSHVNTEVMPGVIDLWFSRQLHRATLAISEEGGSVEYIYADSGNSALSVMGLGRTDRRKGIHGVISEGEWWTSEVSVSERHNPYCSSGNNKPGFTGKKDNLKLILHIISSFLEYKELCNYQWGLVPWLI